MPEEPSTPDLVERTKLAIEAAARADWDTLLSFYRPNAVFESAGLGSFKGVTAIRGFLQEWTANVDDYRLEPEEVVDLGSGVVLIVYRQSGRRRSYRATV